MKLIFILNFHNINFFIIKRLKFKNYFIANFYNFILYFGKNLDQEGIVKFLNKLTLPLKIILPYLEQATKTSPVSEVRTA